MIGALYFHPAHVGHYQHDCHPSDCLIVSSLSLSSWSLLFWLSVGHFGLAFYLSWSTEFDCGADCISFNIPKSLLVALSAFH